MLIYVALFAPAVVGLLAGATSWRAFTGWLTSGANAVVLIAGCLLATDAVHHRAESAFGGALRADALSSFMVIVIGAIALLATTQSTRYLSVRAGDPTGSPRRASNYALLVQLFVTCMLGAVLASNLGVMWIAIEATTVATTFLVGHRGTARALEASWKYIVICSVGIALGFLGTVILYFAALHLHGRAPILALSGAHGSSLLDWTTLVSISHHLDPGVVRLAMALLVLGYGTKVGLAPMHSWLPDAHSQAPAPVSGLMSGVLLSVAFYAILRCKAIADGALGMSFTRDLLIIAGVASLAIAASLMLTQTDYKRMLAYSSMEHMGLIALGAAAGSSLAITAVLLHILGHGLAKTVLFAASGEILVAEGTGEISGIPNLLARRPVLGGIFGFGLVAIAGLPPFSLFISELNMFRAEVDVGLAWVAAIALVPVALIFVAMVGHGRRMLFGEGDAAAAVAPTARLVAAPLITGLAACALFGILAWPLGPLLSSAAQVLGR